MAAAEVAAEVAGSMAQRLESFDFSAFDEPLTPAEVQASKRNTSDNTQKANQPSRAIVIVVSVVFLFSMVNVSATGNYGSISGLVFFAVVVAGVGLYLHRRGVQRRAKLYKFAKQNGLIYTSSEAPSGREGMIFGFGRSQTIADRFTLPDGTEIANYHYTTGSGKSRQTHYWGYIRLPLKRRLPHMVLDSKKNNLFGRLSNLPQTFRGVQKLSLEGDFDNYFTLYAPGEYKTDALYVFTPDVMQALITAGDDYDMEVIDDMMYIYRYANGFDFTSRNEWQSLQSIIGAIGPEIDQQTRRYADVQIGNRVLNQVAEPGRRLKTNTGWIIFAAVFIIVAIYVAQFLFAWRGLDLLR